MVTTTLVMLPREEREAGWRLLDWLSQKQFPLKALFWKAGDEGGLRLFLATTLVDTEGPLHVYHTLQTALADLEPIALELSDISVVSPQSLPVGELRHPVGELRKRELLLRYGTVVADRRVIRRIELTPGESYVYHLE